MMKRLRNEWELLKMIEGGPEGFVQMGGRY